MKLIEPNKKYLKKYEQAYIKSIELISLGKMRKHNLMFKSPKEIDLLDNINNKTFKKLKVGRVNLYDYFLIDDDENLLGVLSIKPRLSDVLHELDGNIRYGINPFFWNKGYGAKILELGIQKAKELGLKDKILITCDYDNIASSKIIEKNGGILQNLATKHVDNENILTKRYWIYL